MNDCQIVPLNKSHINSYREILDAVAKERKYLSFLKAPSLEAVETFLLNNIRQNYPHFLAIIDGEVVGWCNISGNHFEVYQHVGTLGIGVLKKFRSKGIGKALILKTLEQAKHNGLKRIELTVRENNLAAITLYQKLGFQTEGLHHNALALDGHFENVITMALLFS